MDALYRGMETALLALCLAIGVAVTAFTTMPGEPLGAHSSVTLPLIEIVAGEIE